MKNIVILRPGALGDILVCRHLLHALKSAFPGAKIVFVAPGERGKLPGRFGLADATLDWENAAFAWLFSEDAENAPPKLLRELFTPDSLTLAYLDLGKEEAVKFRNRLNRLPAIPSHGAPEPLRIVLSPSRPPDGTDMYIGEWLTRNALEACGLRPGTPETQDADLIVDAGPDASALVIHPGSGSAKKNWPLPSFAALAGLLAAEEAGTGLTHIRIAAGGADGGLGERLAAMLPDAEVIVQPTLAGLTDILASAALYVGNDSGVTHVASAVRSRNGRKPKVAAVFGHSDPAVWAAPGTLVLRAGEGMDGLSPEIAFSLIRRTFFRKKA